jgi:ATP-dependent DNA helicase RecG
VTALNGVGPKIAEKLKRLGAESVLDLLYLFPRRYDDYSLFKPINKLKYGEQVTVIGTIWQTRARRTRNNQPLVQSLVNDGTATIQATWYGQPWLAEQLPAGMQVVLSGKVDQYLGQLVFQSPEWEPMELEPLRTRRIVPVYPLTEGLQSNRLREIMRKAVGEWAGRVPDPVPADIRHRQKFYNLSEALRQMHFPDSQDALYHARRRLAFDELFLLQLGRQKQRREWQAQPAIPLAIQNSELEQFRNALPFQLTGAQERVVHEIRDALARELPMNRLLQGDVGSGKTAVAAAAMFIAARSGAQAALMAPTEILAEQHFQSLEQLLAPLGVSVCLLTGSTPAADRAAIYEGVAQGTIQVAIGTHALIQEAVTFHKLGLAIIDEQHRFGVDQRGALRQKGPAGEGPAGEAGPISPHLLVMSATPIPRTLALSLFGDLDLSTLDEMPPGRQEIRTHWLRATERERAYNFIRRQAAEGRQAYIIYPLVEDSDVIDAGAAVSEFKRLQEQIFPNLRVGLVHGRISSAEKDATMRAFRDGELDVLVATAVIEVGVDVPNSNVIIIENADRFGLAQLHQFRGRVGRGEHQSYCILIAEDVTADAEERLTALSQTNDGFALAEKDLALRGPGEFFGRRQSGIPELRLASLLHDADVLTIAQKEAGQLVEADPLLEKPEHWLLRERVLQFWESAGDVS